MSSVRNLIIILALAIVLPVLVFTGMELAKLNEDERILQDIYVQQIDAVIFSINQYSEDFTRSFVNEISGEWTRSRGETLISDGLRLVNLALVGAAVQTDTTKAEFFDPTFNTPTTRRQLDSIFTAQAPLIERLITYKEVNYTKLEPIGQWTLPNGQTVYLILSIIGIDTPMLLVMDATLFLEDLMKPRLQQIAGENLVISVCAQGSNEEIITTSSTEAPVVQTAKLWLLPNFEIKVAKTGETMDELLAYRRSRNLLTLGLLLVAIILGAFLMFRAVRRESLAAKAKSDFVANVSHEIRTPLSLISMFNETLLSGKITTEAKRQEYYNIIDLEIQRLNAIVTKILSFSRLDAGLRSYEMTPIQPDAEIGKVADTYALHLSKEGFSVQMNLQAQGTHIRADKDALAEAFVNLLDNAMKYSLAEKVIEVTTKVEGGFYVVEVTDKGIGIAEDHQPFIFDKFYRVKGDKDYSVRGTGLGLSLVKNIVEAHGGKVQVQSVFGEGSIFRLYFPVFNHG